ncbi:hypothetical protein Tco_0827266 [Tanacetum coccineum]
MSGTNPVNVETAFQTDTTNNNVTNNVTLIVTKDFSSWRDRFLVCLGGLEPYLLEILENGPYVPKPYASTASNVLIKPQKQWSLEDKKLGPPETRDTKITTLRLKFNAFKALEREKDSDSDVEEDTRSSKEFLADLNLEFHDRALLANQKRFYKRSGRVRYKALKAELALLTRNIKVVSKNKSEKGLVAESFDWDEESLSLEDEGITTVKTFMAIAEDEPDVGKTDARSEKPLNQFTRNDDSIPYVPAFDPVAMSSAEAEYVAAAWCRAQVM